MNHPDSQVRIAPVRVSLVDNCLTFRLGLRHALDRVRGMQVIAECATAAEARQGNAGKAHVAVVDMDLPGEGGLDLCRWLLSEYAGVHVLMLSYWNWDVLLAAAHEAGAYGFLLRSAPIKELRTAIRQAAAAPIWSESQRQRAEAYHRDVGRRLAALAPRERQVLGLLAAGLSTREMAARLAVSENTLEKHVGAILRKTELGSRKALLAFVLAHHLDALASPPEGAAPCL